MNSKFTIYVLDTETTGLDSDKNEIIEISFYRLSDDVQKTWFLKPNNYDSIQPDALRINGHKLEDLNLSTKYGKETYQDPAKVIVEIENWMGDDLGTSEDRVLVGQNPSFDIGFMKTLWAANKSSETFPFGKRPFVLDTRQIALFMDIATNKRNDYYNLGSLVEKYGVKKEKSHRSDSDTRMTKDVFLAQMQIVADALQTSKSVFGK
jgi:DNA polymerase III epsilon subunit-like protein